MRTANAQRVLLAVLIFVLILWAPQSVLAQRGHGGGGGGFHGSAGSWHGGGWNGGGGWHGGSVSWSGGNVWRGGRYGWGGGYWGSPGWRFAIGFNFGPFWGGWGYAWAPFYPVYFLYPYPYFVPVIPAPRAFVSAQSAGGSNSYAVQQSSVPTEELQGAPARQNPPALESAPAPNSPNIRNASYAPASPHYSSPSAPGSSATVRPAVSTTQQVPNFRPEVQNVIRALRAMPPAARQRQMDSGRYSNLTPAELQIVRRAANVPPA